jgi:cellulose synthase/poly-beta-1,6-N-acetylglucosamine synthase-like glycosyltransferase
MWLFVFWICVAAVAYNYVGYPILLYFLVTFSQVKSDFHFLVDRTSRRCARIPNHTPRVAILVAAYNEEEVIRAKVQNTLQIDYPPSSLELMIGLDAPTDSTAEILSELQCPQCRVIEFSVRRGKLAVIRDLAEKTSADILVFTDANTLLNPECIRNLTRHFADPEVGAVSGEEIRLARTGIEPSTESWYWRYESALKFLENRLNCMLGANGSVYAVRRSLFKTQDSIVEDFQVPLEIRFAGYRVVYDPEVVATEDLAPTFAAHFERRVRLGAGSYQTLFKNLKCLNPFRGLPAFSYFSHKVLRWLTPFFLLIAFLVNVRLVARPIFAALLMMQLAFYSLASLGYFQKKRGKSNKVFSIPFGFSYMNLALLVGFYRYVTGRQATAWRVTPRHPSSRPAPAETRQGQ